MYGGVYRGECWVHIRKIHSLMLEARGEGEVVFYIR